MASLAAKNIKIMTEKELNQFRRSVPKGMPEVEIVTKEDEFGVYSTGVFYYKGKSILVQSGQGGLWHVYIYAKHPLGFAEIKDVRYKFLPDKMEVAQIFPPREIASKQRTNSYHLFQLVSVDDGIVEE